MQNLFLKELELTNIQSHSHLLINFVDGVNIICGPTDSGKSSIIRAIGNLFFNTGGDLRKEGTKKSSIKGTLSNGIIIEKVKSESVNRYIVTKGTQVDTYDAIGKTIPEDILKITQMLPFTVEKEELILNISSQITLPFLMGKDTSAIFRMKLLNKLTNNDLIDIVFQGLNKDILQLGRDEKYEAENISKLEKDLGIISLELSTKKEKAKEINDKLVSLKLKFTKLETYQALQLKLKLNAEELDKNKILLKSIKFPEASILNFLQKKIKSAMSLQTLWNRYCHTQEELKDNKVLLKNIKVIPSDIVSKLQLKITKILHLIELKMKLQQVTLALEEAKNNYSKLVIPKFNIAEIKKKIDRLNLLVDRQDKIRNILEDLGETSTLLVDCKNEIDNSNKEYKDILMKVKVCPLTNLPINGDCLKGVKI